MSLSISKFPISALLILSCTWLHATDTLGQNLLRDEAAGVKADLAAPTAEDTTSTKDEEDVFLDEYMNYQIHQLKNWKLRVFASGGVRHDSNVFLTNTNEQSDVMWSARPGFQYSYGDEQARLQFLTDYSAQFNFFEKFATQDSVNQFLSMSLGYRLKKTSFKLGGRITDVTGGDLDVGGQAQRLQFSPELQMIYEVSEKVRIGISGQLQRSHYDSLLSSTTWRFGFFADYAFSPQFRLGVQFNEMVQNVEQSGRQTGEDFLMRVEWEAFKKLSLTGTWGMSVLHTVSAGDKALTNGALGFRYALSPKTTLNVNLYARAQNSPSLTGQYFQSEGVSVGIQQQMGSKINLGADLGYETSKYSSYLAGVASNRLDNVVYVRPWMKYTLHRHLSLELFYQYTSDESTGAGARGFDRSLVGGGITSSW